MERRFTTVQTVFSPSGLPKLVYYSKPDGIERERHEDIIKLLAEDRDVRLTSLTFFSLSSPDLTEKEREGMVLFVGLVSHADRIVDTNNLPNFDSSDHFSDWLLKSEITKSNESLTLKSLLFACQSCFDGERNESIIAFIDQMSNLQTREGNSGVPGQYGFEEALKYKAKTNYSYINTAMILGRSLLAGSNSLLAAVNAAQIVDDLWDWRDDWNSETQNLLLGAASDVWNKKGNPNNQDLAMMKNQPTTSLSPRKFMRLPQMRDTRTVYQDKFKAEIGNVPQDFPYRKMLDAWGRLSL